MADWKTLREDIEFMLGSSQKWNERELMLYTNWCIRRVINKHFPQESSTVLATDGTTQSWSVPADFLAVRHVEVPADTFLEEIQRLPGTAYYSTLAGLPNMYYVESSQLKLTAAPSSGDVLTLHYEAKHDEVTLDTSVLSMNDEHFELISKYVRAQAAGRQALKQGGQDAYKMPGVDSGNPQHNPYTPLMRVFQADYQATLESLLPVGNVQIYRRGRGA